MAFAEEAAAFAAELDAHYAQYPTDLSALEAELNSVLAGFAETFA